MAYQTTVKCPVCGAVMDEITHGEPVLQIALQTSERVDLEKLRTKYPKDAADCSSESASFVYRKPKKGTK